MRVPRGGSILGLDLSLKGPAAAVLPWGWAPGDWRSVRVDQHRPDEPEPGFRGQYLRIQRIVERLIAFAHLHHVSYGFVENYGFSRQSASVTKLAELGGHARVAFLDVLGIELIPVPSTQWRRMLLGRNPVKDAKVLTHNALLANGAPHTWSGDALDAFGVANWGISELGLTALCLEGSIGGCPEPSAALPPNENRKRPRP